MITLTLPTDIAARVVNRSILRDVSEAEVIAEVLALGFEAIDERNGLWDLINAPEGPDEEEGNNSEDDSLCGVC